MTVTPNPAHRLTAAILAAVLAIVLMPLQLVWSSPAAAETTQITSGSVTWGVKASWRGYAGVGTQSGGVSQNGDGEYVFPVVDGSYDSETGTTTVAAQGTVHWQGHWYPNESSSYAPPAGYTGTLDLFVLDVTLSDPVVTLSSDGAEVTVELVSRNTATWEVVDYGRIPLANLDFSASTPAVTSSTTTWTDLPAAWTDAGVAAIGYSAGLMVDPLSFTYAGPGGAPDVSESWTPAGSTGIEYVDHTADTVPSTPAVLWVDAARRLAHVTWSTNVEGVATRFVQAYDLTTLAAVGTPFAVTGAERNRVNAPSFFDPTAGALYYSSLSAAGAIDRTLTFDPDTDTYTRTVLASPITMQGSASGVLWDPVRERAITVTRVVPGGVSATDYDLHEWRATTYTRGEDGVFTEKVHVLPNGPTGWNRTWYGSARSGAVSSDGSIVLPRENVVPAAGATALTGLEAHHITLGESTAAVAEIDGTSLPEAGTSQQSLYGYNLAVAGPGGRVYLVRLAAGSYQTKVLQVQIDGDGNAAAAADPVDLGTSQPRTFSVDKTDGTLWGQAINNQHVVGVRDGRVVNDTYSSYINPRIQGIVVDADRTVFTVAFDGEPLELGEIPGVGFARFARLGVSPTITTQPAADPVTLATGQDSAPVALTVAAEGEPAPDAQWQRKAPGSSRFADIDGQTSNTLDIDATRASDQAQYRAVFTNAAGRIATDVATLEVRSAPLIETQPADHTVTAGGPATFTVQTSGSPEPQVVWQRRVAGFWQDISTDDNFTIDAGTLVVSDTNVDQSGSLFRAKVRNTIDTVFSRTAKLSVEPALTEPQTATGGTLTWGVKQSFRTYVAGPIAQGAIAVTGATTNPDGTYAFPVQTGTYDPTSKELTVESTGAVRFTGHHGSLDLTISNLALRHDGAGGLDGEGVLVADVVSKDQSSGVLVTYDDLELATVDTGSADSVVPGLFTISSRTTTLTTAGAAAFAGFYSAGATMDPISGTVELADGPATEPVPTTTTVKLAKGRFTYGSTTSALVTVVADGARVPSGDVTLATAGRTVTGALVGGSARLQLPAGIDPGTRTLRVTYEGTTTTTGSSVDGTYRVVRAKPTIRAAYPRVGNAGDHRRVKVRLTVPKAGKHAVGQLIVRDHGRVIAAKQLRQSDRGRVVVRLPRLRPGRHVLTVSLAATDRYQAVRTTIRIVRVPR
jgi:hypothetical protein